MVATYNQRAINILSLIIGLVAVFITAYGQFKDPQTGTVLFLGVLVFVVLYFIASYIMGKFNQVNRNTQFTLDLKKDLNNLKDKYDIIKDGVKLNARLSFLENKMKNKKGQIDPRIIIILIILILLFLYLKSKGIF